MSLPVTESPDTLQNLCLNYIASKILSSSGSCEGVCANDTTHSAVLQNSLRSFSGTFVHSNVADSLLSRMSACRTLCNETMELFQSGNTSLRHVVIHRSPVTAAGLRILRSHKLITLVIESEDPKQFTVTDVMYCLNEWTVANLRSLSVTGVNFVQAVGTPVVVSLCALRNLHSLDVSRTDFNENMLKIVVDDLAVLESIDISATLVRDVTSLSQCRTRLRRLLMYNVRLNDSANCVNVLRSLCALQVLDVSRDPPSNSFTNMLTNHVTTTELLHEGSEFHDLHSLDISGTPDVPIRLIRYQNIINSVFIIT